MRRRRLNRARKHAAYELAPGLLLVFKPRRHAEPPHSHLHRQRLLVLRGRLEVRQGARRLLLDPARPRLALSPAALHATRALEDTWLLVEAAARSRRRRAPRGRRAL
ncbi:MAG: hypothetical protein ACREQY_18725 [Candidatus Binatia bacterium]